MGEKPEQQQQQRQLAGIPDLKIKFLEPLREHVIEPLRADLVRRQAQLRGEISQPGLAKAAKAERELQLQEIDRALRVVDLEFERAKALRLSDFNVPAGLVGKASELTVR